MSITGVHMHPHRWPYPRCARVRIASSCMARSPRFPPPVYHPTHCTKSDIAHIKKLLRLLRAHQYACMTRVALGANILLTVYMYGNSNIVLPPDGPCAMCALPHSHAPICLQKRYTRCQQRLRVPEILQNTPCV